MENTLEIDEIHIKEILDTLNRMCKRNYQKLIGVEVGKINHVFELEVEDKDEQTGKRIEYRIISSELFDAETDVIKRVEETFVDNGSTK